MITLFIISTLVIARVSAGFYFNSISTLRTCEICGAEHE